MKIQELLKEEFLSEKIVILLANSLEEAIEIINENSEHLQVLLPLIKIKRKNFKRGGATTTPDPITDGGEWLREKATVHKKHVNHGNTN